MASKFSSDKLPLIGEELVGFSKEYFPATQTCQTRSSSKKLKISILIILLMLMPLVYFILMSMDDFSFQSRLAEKPVTVVVIAGLEEESAQINSSYTSLFLNKIQTIFFTVKTFTHVFMFVLSKTSEKHFIEQEENSVSMIQVTPHLSNELQCTGVSDLEKFDCFPDLGVNETACVARGCCWKPIESHSLSSKNVPLNTPYCYYPANYKGYCFQSSRKTPTRTQAYFKRKTPSGFTNDIKEIEVDIISYDDQRLRIKVTDPSRKRFVVPIPEIPNKEEGFSPAYQVHLNTTTGVLKVTRKQKGTVIFDTDISRLVFTDQFIELSTRLASHFIYGIGEQKDHFLRPTNWTRYTLFNRDEAPVEHMNLYGSHPFYLVMEDDSNSHGVFLFNSNAMDIILQPTPALTFRTIGGILDFFIFSGPTPANVIKQYVNLIGQPIMPPYWSLGFHLCRYGYNSVNVTRATWARTRKANIPFDVQWNDIDYMERNNDFTYDQKTFKELPAFVNEIHNAGMHYVVMFDPGISSGEEPGTYPPYDQGLQMDIFVRNSTGQIFEGKVWNYKLAVFPDFTNLRTVDYWTDQLQNFHKKINFDGAWIDMNEPSNFYNGQKDGCPSDSPLEHPPYVPGSDPLYTKTFCMTVQHNLSVHYNVHNLYGFFETIATNIALVRTRGQKRPFIISRSTFPGHGYFGGHWDGDVFSSWDHMRWSIPSILNFNMFGIPMMGSDICGFNGNTTEELCARWSALGAFYPFSRNHNSDGQIEQDPVALGPLVVTAARNALTTRYYLLPFLYTLFFRSHTAAETVVRPLFFEYPEDKNTYTVETQFFWGSALMVIPALYEKVNTVTAYFPADTWYDFYTGTSHKSTGQNFTLDAPMDKINLVVRSGVIIPSQEPNDTTTASRKNPFHLLVALDKNGRACGELYWDDGDTLDTYSRGVYNLIVFEAEKNRVTSQVRRSGYETAMLLKRVRVFGVSFRPRFVHVNRVAVHFQYLDITKVLEIEAPKVSLLNPLDITWK
ncbi:lysosomal alpha-glucosidase-like [Tachypleus tridentatus]|uniref:lysosomal alpha-glucosidase-like n=1 Tax=Tachypleus tridentatus TaxID=6853 RepID=UPI003FD404B2